ncbi:MAG: ISL3 family transposase [Geminicoccaceae bacterium]
MRTDCRTLPAADLGSATGVPGGELAGRLFGLPGFAVLVVAEYGGELELLIEMTEAVTGCPRCGVLAQLHDRRPRLVRDLPVGGRPVLLVWHKRVWRCPEPDCVQRTWSERTPAIGVKAVLTERARVEACRRVGQDAHSVAAVAADLGVGWPTIMRAVRHYGQQILDAQWLHTAVVKLGVDETAFLAATATSHTRFVTGLVDLAPAAGGPARLLDVVEGRSGKVVTDWLEERGTDWCNDVQVAALDPFRGYETALRTGLPGATVVLDAFHAVKLAQTAVDTVRRRVQQEQTGHRGHKDDPLYRIRRVLLRGAENLTEKAYGRLLAGLDAGDSGGQVGKAWIAAQELRHVYGARDIDQARRRLQVFYWACADSDVPELLRLARTISGWEDQLLAYFTTGRISNGPTEAVNLLIKRIKRVGFGFRNFANYRLRLLLHCGITWHTPRTARIRGRSPRLVS